VPHIAAWFKQLCLWQVSSALLESDFPMPHKPRKGVPFFDEEEEEEAYCAAPFNMNAPDVEAPLPTTFTEDGEEVTGVHLLLYSDS